jgi:uncharacterized protein (UPF0261 family)
MLTIAVLGTLDTKGAEHAFVAEQIQRAGHRALLIDVGTKEPPTVTPDITRHEILQTGVDSPSSSQEAISSDRGQAIAVMSKAAPRFLRQLVDANKIHGIISLGGSGGTAIATATMRALPLGFPKVMVSTMASGTVSHYVDVSDIAMFPSIVDVSGLNRIAQGVYSRAAAAVVAMAEANDKSEQSSQLRPIVAASMFGNTTRCVEYARQILESAGYEVIVFHATGVGGRTMEALIDSGVVAGVLDVTTTEWADQLVGGVMPGGPNRLTAAARKAIPAVVAPGCLDMVNFGEPNSVPAKFAGRKFYQHNPQVTLMRTSVQECKQLGQIIATKLNESRGPIRLMFPMKAISVISAQGQPFYDPEADRALLTSLRETLRPDIPLDVIDCEINDELFAQRCAAELLAAMG